LPWPILHFAGVLLLFLPAVFLSGRAAPEFFALALAPWLAGAALAAVGALGWYSPFRAWWRWLVTERFLPLVLLAVAALLPTVIVWVQPIWHWSTLAATTFAAVQFLLVLLGQAPLGDPAAYIIGIDDFIVEISRQCAGIESFVLVTAFLGLYAFLFRSDTRLPRFWLLLPVALLLSWAFNVARITTLILIGAHVSPSLAVNGFHSYAGWIFFTILALTILVVARRLAWLRVRPAGAAEAVVPLRDDWNAARVLPFVAFMAASMIGSALFEDPDAAYPFKAAVMALALLPFARFYRAIDWRLDPAALAAGLAAAALWVAPTLLGLEAPPAA
jgi:exosortase E/protease (VPEID-CTERM system)